jgi:nanoRNase/pAp phosphatase (c-di-AMP/oligoRNAs hydrolase)
MQIRESQFGSFIKEYKNVLFLCHRNADPDAIGSGFALQSAFGGSLGVIEGIGRLAREQVEAIGAAPIVNPQIESYDLVVVVDTSVWLQLGDLRPSKYAVVDHHQDDELLSGAEFYIHRNTDSTAEIVFKILLDNDSKITSEVALGLLLGIITDTGRFRHASTSSFRITADLLEIAEVEYAEALEILSRRPTELSQRIAALKAAERSVLEWSGDWIVATTEVNAFEGSCAMVLVQIGADVAFAGGKHGKLCRISGRARYNAIQAGIDLSEIMREVARAHGGEGGGHRGAAALELEGDLEVLLDACRKMVMDRLMVV